jgi:hypothetical protein
MNWLTQSFQQYTVAWIVISSLVGGMIGAFVKFLFEDVLRPFFGWRRDTAAIVRRYTTPLIRSAESLERRINILVRNEQRKWFEEDEYFRLSTLYVLGEYLGWVRIVERRFGFLPFESSRRGRKFNRHLNGLFRALTSHAYFRAHPDTDAVERSVVPRLMLTAIGEAMRREGENDAVLGFTEFLLAYARDPQFRRWFADIESLLRSAHRSNPLCWDRLIAAEATLRALVVFLDPRGAMTASRKLANLELLVDEHVARALEEEFPHLVDTPRGSHAEPRSAVVLHR